MASPNKSPAAKVRIGAVQAAIWENPTANGTRFNVTLSRLYKQEDSWRSSNSFGRDDLLLVAKVVDRAHDLICELQRGE